MSLIKRLLEYFYLQQTEEEDPEKPVVEEVVDEDDKDIFIEYINKNPK